MAGNIEDLPDDPAELKRIIIERNRAIEAMEQQIDAERQRHKAEIDAERQRLEAEHKAAVDAILRRFYGPRSESFDPRQLLIFGLAMAETAPVDPAVVEAESGEPLITRKIARRHKHGRGVLPDHLPRIEVIHDLMGEQKKCPCCNNPRACIGSEDSEQLEFIPASFKVMLACSDLIRPLVDLMSDRVRQSKVIHTDDTTVKVQDASRKGTCRTGRIWCYLGDQSHPYDAFNFSPDRKREHPQRFLDAFKGYLQADAYGGYDGIYAKQDVTEVACWAHARRKFFEARDTDGKRSAQMLEFVRQLYAIEDQAKALDHDIRRDLRQSKSRPILDRIKTWLDVESPIVLPRSPMGQAITYTLNQWTALTRYTDEGYLNIDNNAAERALKRVAIGRKNWLFAGHDAAGQSHARLYTLIASAQRHGLDPQKYLMSVLAKIGQTKLSELHQFLPDRWKAEDHATTGHASPATHASDLPPFSVPRVMRV